MTRIAANCRSCGREIDWAYTAAGKRMPVDRDSIRRPGGNLGVRVDPATRQLICRVLTADHPLQPGEILGTAHWATCPNARAHKQAGRQS